MLVSLAFLPVSCVDDERLASVLGVTAPFGLCQCLCYVFSVHVRVLISGIRSFLSILRRGLIAVVSGLIVTVRHVFHPHPHRSDQLQFLSTFLYHRSIFPFFVGTLDECYIQYCILCLSLWSESVFLALRRCHTLHYICVNATSFCCLLLALYLPVSVE